MIRALIAKDLRLITRDASIRTVFLGYLLVFLTAGVVFCSGVLTANDEESARRLMTSLFPRLTVLQAALLAGITPWLIQRIAKEDRGNNLVRWIACISAAPWQVLLGKVTAAGICLAELLSLSLPVLYIARLLGATSFRRIAWSLMDTFLFLMLLALLVFHFSMRGGHWAVSWVLSYTILIALGLGWYEMSLAIDRTSGTLVSLLLVVLLGSLLFFRGNRTLVYLRS